ncbi:MAG: hypothetical protein KQH63_07950 [Desulfobulbaceae bacterium]|nr:hypothetical protein [Desulfobulbaceae bacterium]
MAITAINAQNLYQNQLRPVWVQYEQGNPVQLPANLTINPSLNIDGGAVPGFVETTQGALNLPNDSLVWFCIAHEMSHHVTQSVLAASNQAFPAVGLALNSKMGEHVADLIAFHTFMTDFPIRAKQIVSQFPALTNLLGAGDNMHPSGNQRVLFLQSYYDAVTRFGMANVTAFTRLIGITFQSPAAVVPHHEWVDKTSRSILHTRSRQLKDVDTRLETYITNPVPANRLLLRNSFDTWFQHNPKERKKRNKGFCVLRLFLFLHDW